MSKASPIFAHEKLSDLELNDLEYNRGYRHGQLFVKAYTDGTSSLIERRTGSTNPAYDMGYADGIGDVDPICAGLWLALRNA